MLLRHPLSAHHPLLDRLVVASPHSHSSSPHSRLPLARVSQVTRLSLLLSTAQHLVGRLLRATHHLLTLRPQARVPLPLNLPLSTAHVRARVHSVSLHSEIRHAFLSHRDNHRSDRAHLRVEPRGMAPHRSGII